MAMKISSGAASRTNILSAAQKAGEQANTESAARTGRRQETREDTLELSEEALAILQGKDEQKAEDVPEDFVEPRELSPEEQKLQDKLNGIKAIRQMLDTVKQQSAQMAEQSEKQADAMKESLDKMKRCSKIAKNIMKGHKVPPKDEKYLLETDPKLYMMAMAMRMLKEPDNKKVKSELKDEEQQQDEAAAEVDSAGSDMPADIAVEAGAEVSVE